MLYILALHIIFVVTWFAGLFYIVRLFVYHSEADRKSEPERSVLIAHFKIAERRLWYGITWPSAIGTYLFGFWLLFDRYGLNIPDWLIIKLLFVGGLTFYHLSCGWIFSQFRNDNIRYSSMQLRIWNEVATLFLVSIVFIVILKSTLDWMKVLAGLILFSALLVVAIKVYGRFRKE